MTVASITDLTQWVADRLFENTWSVEFTVTRYYVPFTFREQMTLPSMSVFAPTIESTPSPRTQTTDDVAVAVRLYAGMDPTQLAEQDKHIRLLEEVRDYFRHQSPPKAMGCDFFGSSQLNFIESDELLKLNLFSAQVNLDYKCRRDTGA